MVTVAYPLTKCNPHRAVTSRLPVPTGSVPLGEARVLRRAGSGKGLRITTSTEAPRVQQQRMHLATTLTDGMTSPSSSQDEQVVMRGAKHVVMSTPPTSTRQILASPPMDPGGLLRRSPLT